jgi:hypothetical protein
VKNTDITNLYLVTHEVNVDFDVFGTPMLHGVNGQVDSRHIITIHNSRSVNWTMQLLQKMMNPTTLSNNMRNRTVLSFST